MLDSNVRFCLSMLQLLSAVIAPRPSERIDYFRAGMQGTGMQGTGILADLIQLVTLALEAYEQGASDQVLLPVYEDRSAGGQVADEGMGGVRQPLQSQPRPIKRLLLCVVLEGFTLLHRILLLLGHPRTGAGVKGTAPPATGRGAARNRRKSRSKRGAREGSSSRSSADGDDASARSQAGGAYHNLVLQLGGGRNRTLLCSFLTRLHFGQIEGLQMLPPGVAASISDLSQVLGTSQVEDEVPYLRASSGNLLVAR
jgi:hypothetical protein